MSSIWSKISWHAKKQEKITHDWKKKSIEADPELMQTLGVLLNLKI